MLFQDITRQSSGDTVPLLQVPHGRDMKRGAAMQRLIHDPHLPFATVNELQTYVENHVLEAPCHDHRERYRQPKVNP